MKHFILFYDYPPDYLERRGALRPAHFDHASAAVARGDLVLGGVLNDPLDGAALLFRAESKEVVEEFARNDPYVIHGLATTWRVREWTTVIGAQALSRV